MCVSEFGWGPEWEGGHLQPNVKVCRIKGSSRLVSIMKDVQAVNVSVMMCLHYNAMEMTGDEHTPAESKHHVNGDDGDIDNKNTSGIRKIL